MLKLTLSSHEFGIYDFGTSITFRIYNEDETVFDASTYTGEIIISDIDGNELFRLTPSWTTQNQGIGTFAFDANNYLSSEGHYFVEVQLTKSGVQKSTENVRIVALRSST
ncbi:MAG: hypothetical protein HZC29_04825 [Thaumarchaeota archaeon]|nr:hypothetical protein [Nitrososphaerota archaeon]